MPEFKIRTPDGQYFNVTMPPGSTREDAIAYAKAHRPPPAGPIEQAPIINAPGTEPGGVFDPARFLSRMTGGLLESPKGFRGPGLLSNVGAMIQRGTKGAKAETPQQVYDRSIPAFETMADIFGTLGLPGSTVLGRMAGGIGVPAFIAMLGGKDPIEQGLKGGLAQTGAETVMGLVKAKRLGSLAETARAAFEKKLAAQTDKTAQDTAMLNALETLDKQRHGALVNKMTQEHTDLTNKLTQEYNQKVSSHEELLAGSFMDEAKKAVPAWKDIPSTVAGLYTAVLGKGKDLLSAAFDTALQAAKGTATGKTANIPVSDARALKVAVREDADRVLPTDKTDLRMLVPVDASELIDAIVGLKDKGLKARAHQALSEANLGVAPEAMREYTVGKGTIETVNENKIFKFDPETNKYSVDSGALTKGLLSREHMDTPQNRGMGDFDTLPPLQIAKAGPTPPEIPPLQLPEPPAPRGPLGSPPILKSPDETGAISEIKLPGTHYSRGATTAGILGLLGGILGQTHGGHGLGVGGGAGALGYGLGSMLPDKVVTKAPMGPLEKLLGELIPKGLGTAARNVEGVANAAEGSDTDPILRRIAELAKIDAEIQAASGQTDPRLQLLLNRSDTAE